MAREFDRVPLLINDLVWFHRLIPQTAEFLHMADALLVEVMRGHAEDEDTPIGRAMSARRAVAELPQGTTPELARILVRAYSRAIDPIVPILTGSADPLRRGIARLKGRLRVTYMKLSPILPAPTDYQRLVDALSADLYSLGIHEPPPPPLPEDARSATAVRNAIGKVQEWLERVEASLGPNESGAPSAPAHETPTPPEQTPVSVGRPAEFDEVALAAHEFRTANPKQPWSKVYRHCFDRFGRKKLPAGGNIKQFAPHVRARWKALGLAKPKRK